MDMRPSLLLIFIFFSCNHYNNDQYPDDRIHIKERTLNNLGTQIKNTEMLFIFKFSINGEDEFIFNKKTYKGELVYTHTRLNNKTNKLLESLKKSFYIDKERFPVLKPYPSYFIAILGSGFMYKISVSRTFIHFMISENSELAFGGTIEVSKRDLIKKILEDIR